MRQMHVRQKRRASFEDFENRSTEECKVVPRKIALKLLRTGKAEEVKLPKIEFYHLRSIRAGSGTTQSSSLHLEDRVKSISVPRATRVTSMVISRQMRLATRHGIEDTVTLVKLPSASWQSATRLWFRHGHAGARVRTFSTSTTQRIASSKDAETNLMLEIPKDPGASLKLHYQRWSRESDEILKRMWVAPSTISEIVHALGRTHRAIYARLRRLGYHVERAKRLRQHYLQLAPTEPHGTRHPVERLRTQSREAWLAEDR